MKNKRKIIIGMMIIFAVLFLFCTKIYADDEYDFSRYEDKGEPAKSTGRIILKTLYTVKTICFYTAIFVLPALTIIRYLGAKAKLSTACRNLETAKNSIIMQGENSDNIQELPENKEYELACELMKKTKKRIIVYIAIAIALLSIKVGIDKLLYANIVISPTGEIYIWKLQ